MSDFVSVPPAPASPPNSKILAGPFWPDLDCTQFRESMRLGDTTITHARLIDGLKYGLVTVLSDIRAWQAEQVAAGYATANDIPDQMQIGDEKSLAMLFRRACYAYATADLIRSHPDITATKAGADRAEYTGPCADDHEANGVTAVRELLGQSRIMVALI